MNTRARRATEVRAMAHTISSAAPYTDEEFLCAVESLTISNATFHHRDHIRLAWVYLRRFGLAEAEKRMTQTLRRFATHHGVPEKYHHTMTVCWMRLVADALWGVPASANFEDFIAAHPKLLDRNTLHRYYSHTLVDSAKARAEWAEPDLAPLPE